MRTELLCGLDYRKKIIAFGFVVFSGIVFAAVGGFFETIYTTFSAGGGELQDSTGNQKIVYSVGGNVGHSTMEGGAYSLEGGFLPGSAPGRQPAEDLSESHAFPVPFRPDKRHTKITFTKLTNTARIRIYTISGELVTTLEKTDITTDEYLWEPVVNDNGEELFSGVYIYYVDKEKDHKSGKIVIIR
ncbi:MAG: T9SS type A sorting domain-containing protein [Elusimicrobiota bacterium]